MKLGVICDGISRDLAHAVDVMDEFGLDYAELQFVGDTEVGDHSTEEINAIDTLLRDRGKPVSCLSRHIFAGMNKDNVPGDPLHAKHMDALKRVIDMAHVVGSPLVRIMTPKKEQILWGLNGAEKWMIDDLDAKDVLKVLWDPANNCWCHERAFPDGYEEVSDGYLGHIHIKDVKVDTPRATLEVREMGTGQLADQFQPLASALKADNYGGVISFESVYHPGNGDFEAGFRACIDGFKSHFA